MIARYIELRSRPSWGLVAFVCARAVEPQRTFSAASLSVFGPYHHASLGGNEDPLHLGEGNA